MGVLQQVSFSRWLCAWSAPALLTAIFLLFTAPAAAASGGGAEGGAPDRVSEAEVPCGWAAGHTLGGVDGPVYALQTYFPYPDNPPTEVLCAAGDFVSAGGVIVNNIAQWLDPGWSPMGGPPPGTDGPVYALAVGNVLEWEAMIAGGYFSTAGGNPTGEVAISDGYWWYPWGDTDGPVFALVTSWSNQGDAYAGGDFSHIDGVPVGSIAHCCWSSLDGGVGSGAVYALEEHDDGAYVGGYFTSAGGVTANSIALWDGTSWSALSGPSGTGVDDEVYAIKVGRADVYVGGWFSTAGGIAASNVARWYGGRWWPLACPAGNGTDSAVEDLEEFDEGHGTALYAAGWFSAAGGVTSNHVARWDGVSWSALTGPYGTGTDGVVYALETHHDVNGPALYVGGSFTTAGGLPSHNIAKWVCEGTPPNDPTSLASTSHIPGTWSRSNVIDVIWAGATDLGGSGVAGYSLLFDQLPTTVPDPTLEVVHVGEPNTASSAPLTDGDSHYFHLLTRDGAGSSSPGLHLGPFWIDTTPPSLGNLWSSSHQVGVPSSDRTVDLVWDPAVDGASGVDGYGWEITASSDWTCDEVKDLEEGATSVAGPPLASGTWYAHLCAVDNVGNWSGVVSAGPFVITAEIFADGFESGDTSAWSLVQP